MSLVALQALCKTFLLLELKLHFFQNLSMFLFIPVQCTYNRVLINLIVCDIFHPFKELMKFNLLGV